MCTVDLPAWSSGGLSLNSWVERIDSGYKLIEFLSGRRGRADTVVSVATVEFRFGTVLSHRRWRGRAKGG